MVLEALVGRGLQHEPASALEIVRFLTGIATRISDARATQVSREGRFDMAYEALLQIGIVSLRLHDLRPDSRGGHHVLALQTLPTTIGAARSKLRLLEEFRRQRAAGLYDGSFLPSQQELDELIANVEELHAILLAWIRTHRPQWAPAPTVAPPT